MKQIIVFLFTISAWTQNHNINFETKVLSATQLSCRAIYIDTDKVWLGLDKGRYGFYDKKTDSLYINTILSVDPKTEFRSIAATKSAVFILAIGNPAKLIKIDKSTLQEKIVYTEENEKVFYDSMQFSDDLNGFAMGDPTADCLSFLSTKDGGNTWQKSTCENFPKVSEGESAFATSNSNLIVRGTSIFMVSGGKQSRVFISTDYGNSWNVYLTPIVQGEAMTGIFTADFYNEKIGIIAGGNYLKQSQNWANKAITFNGGKTWKCVADAKAFGYASCVQFVPHSNGKKILSVGGTGIYYSEDFGKNWIQLSEDKEVYTFRFETERIGYATGKNKLIRFELQ
jgi:photosystem II stability/assembly factor-like uncharacterized protein